MKHRLKEIKYLRNELSAPSQSRYSQRSRAQKLSEEEYIERAEKRKAMKPSISVWMQSPERSELLDDDHNDEKIETFNEERKKHSKERKQHIQRHQNVINQRTFHPESDGNDHGDHSSSDHDQSETSSDSESSSVSSTDSEEERRRRKRRKKRKKRHKHRKRRKSKKRRKRHKKHKKSRRRKHRHHSSSEDDETDTESSDNASSSNSEQTKHKKNREVIQDFPEESDHGVVPQNGTEKEKEKEPETEPAMVWIEENDDNSSSESVESANVDIIGPSEPIDDVTSKLDRRDYGGAMLPGEADAIANFVQRGMRIPRRGEVGLTSQEIAAFEQTGFVMSGSRHKRMNAIRIRKENQIYSAEEKRALTMVNFEEKLNREKKLMAQYQKLLNEKTKK